VTRYVATAAGVVMMAGMGGIYAWSAFAGRLREAFGYERWQMQLVFGTCICVFTGSLIFIGRLHDRFGPRPLAVACGVLLGAGYLLASASADNFPLLWLGIGVLGGLGNGAGYVCPIATGAKWFPTRRGLIAGLAVAGYGGGAIALKAIQWALSSRGWEVLAVFRAVGLLYGPVIVVAGLFLFTPARPASHEHADFRQARLFVDRRFWWLALTFFCATLPGLLVLGTAEDLGAYYGFAAVAELAIVAVAVGNVTGRVTGGMLYDRLGNHKTVLMLLTLVMFSMAGVLLGRIHPWLFLASLAFVLWCYGGALAVYPAEVAHLWSPHLLGSVYPLVLFFHGIGAISGPPLFGLARQLTGRYEPGFAAAALVPLIGLLLHVRLRRRIAS